MGSAHFHLAPELTGTKGYLTKSGQLSDYNEGLRSVVRPC